MGMISLAKCVAVAHVPVSSLPGKPRRAAVGDDAKFSVVAPSLCTLGVLTRRRPSGAARSMWEELKAIKQAPAQSLFSERLRATVTADVDPSQRDTSIQPQPRLSGWTAAQPFGAPWFTSTPQLATTHVLGGDHD